MENMRGRGALDSRRYSLSYSSSGSSVMPMIFARDHPEMVVSTGYSTFETISTFLTTSIKSPTFSASRQLEISSSDL